MDGKGPEVGSVVWWDLTVPDAAAIKDFYSEVVGWKVSPHDMGDYRDFNVLTPESGEVVTGICHARGVNAAIPAQWLLYVQVANVEESAARCVELGGKVIDGPKQIGEGQMCVIQDPAGAVLALIGD
jgi:uncharacterized protein